MKALVFRGPGQFTVEEIPDPELPPDGLILKVEACDICGSDLRTLKYGLRFEKEWHILGHEIAGVVAEVGADVHDYKAGDRLAVAVDVHCNRCHSCLYVSYNLCENWQLIGAHFPGGLVQSMQLPEVILRRGIVHPISQGMASIHAALAESASSVLASQQCIDVSPSEVIVIIGAGP